MDCQSQTEGIFTDKGLIDPRKEEAMQAMSQA
jgi:hypothetical protein